MGVSIERKQDFSGGIQSATSWLLKKENELEDAYNVRFNKYLGAVSRRNGYIKEGNAMIDATPTLGIHEAKFASGNKLFIAQNNLTSSPTATVLEWYQKSLGSSWTNLSGVTIDPNTAINMNDSLGDMYIAGQSSSTGARMAIVNVQDGLTVSTTRNLFAAPKAKYIVEYSGALYAINCTVGSTNYPDRAYRSSQALGAITFVQGYQAVAASTITLKVDSVQYLKPSMTVDIYKAGTETETYDSLSITSVDKNLKTITFNTQSTGSANGSASATNNTIAVTAATLFPTGTPLSMATAGTLPTGLTVNTTYYAIAFDSTDIKLAVTYTDALAGNAIDITGTGSGTSTVYQGFGDNDEFWLHGRKNQLAYLWNTDYPTVDQADFLRITPGIASDSTITAFGMSNNRLFLFTNTATFKWDNANFVTVFDNIGCVNQKSIVNINGWLIWVDAEGQIQARNDSTGQTEVISRGIRNKWLEKVTQAQWLTASAGKSQNVYKICVGTVNGQIWRFNYDFDSNNWSRDIITKTIADQVQSNMGTTMRLYFTDTVGQMWLDEEGNLDDTATIPFYVKLGRDNDGTELMKTYQGHYIFGENTSGAFVKCSYDKGDPQDLGQLNGPISRIAIPSKVNATGRDYNLEITQNNPGDGISIEGLSTFYEAVEDKFG